MKYFISLLLLFSLSCGKIASAGDIPLRDKIGQMLIVGFEGKTVNNDSPIVQSIEKDNLGGVILFDYNYQTKTFDKNIESPKQVKRLNARLQQATLAANKTHHRPRLPLLISIDYEGGSSARLKASDGFPATVSAAQVGQMSALNANATAHRMANTLKEAGFNLNFAPMLDVNVNPNNPIIGKHQRSFSDNPNQVAFYARLYSHNFLNLGVQCAYKHFPGQGSANADSHLGFVDVTNSWKPYELQPYSTLLGKKQACGMVMSAHIVNRQLDNSGLPATLSHQMLTNLLRNQMHFKGVIITDDMQMKAITAHYGLRQAVILAVNAGADMFIFGNQLSDKPQDPKEIIDLIEQAVQRKEISQSRIDEAYQRIQAFKQSL
ncbi:MAG: glycoside hydrolase family 3 N-terminal domain-containing protein [Tatlockia sp.]